jgi:hypothetical protein
MPRTIPLASHEVRWFFKDSVKDKDNLPLKQWFETIAPIAKSPGVGAPEWKGRLDDQADKYLVIPDADDMGIKWRERELQIKGRISSVGNVVFAGQHQGQVEHWVKWSYVEVPPAYEKLFTVSGANAVSVIHVAKTRALRKIHIDTLTGKAIEVDARKMVDRGVGFELTDLSIAGNNYCSLGFEAFPSDAAMHAEFFAIVEQFLSELKLAQLTPSMSRSYPEFLNGLAKRCRPGA